MRRQGSSKQLPDDLKKVEVAGIWKRSIISHFLGISLWKRPWAHHYTD